MKHRLSDHSGYLIIDHRDSPGINPEDVPERLRNITPIVGKNQVYETDVQHCTHCQRAVVLFKVSVGKYEPDICHYCHHYICRSCAKQLRITGQCVPFKAIFDRTIKGEE